MQQTKACSPAEPRAFVVNPGVLSSVVARIPDPRRRQGRRCPLAVAPTLANDRSILARARWDRARDASALVTLGFPAGKVPIVPIPGRPSDSWRSYPVRTHKP
jgi:hypothetical protein